MKIRLTLLLVVVTVCGAVRMSAHHSLTAVYDTASLVSLTGAIASVDVVNPHVRVLLDVKDPGGRVNSWTIDLAPPSGLLRRKVDPRLLKAGEQVTIESWLRKDGKKEATGRTLVMSDGRRVDVGDSLGWSMATASR